MEDFSDSTNRVIIIIVMFIYYLYTKYRQTQLLMLKHVQNVSCNPLEMIVGGIINPEQSNDAFSACMQYVTAENTNKSIQKSTQNYQSQVSQLVADLSANQDSANTSASEQQQDLLNVVSQQASNANDLVNQQMQINDSIIAADTPIQGILQKISGLSSTLVSIFEKLPKYDQDG